MSVDIIQKRLSSIPNAPAVVEYRVELGTDSTGDPAAWVFVVVNEDELERLWPVWDQVREEIRDGVAEVAGSATMVYVRMWASNELDDRVRFTGATDEAAVIGAETLDVSSSEGVLHERVDRTLTVEEMNDVIERTALPER